MNALRIIIVVIGLYLFSKVWAEEKTSTSVKRPQNTPTLQAWMAKKYSCFETEDLPPANETDLKSARTISVELKENPKLYFIPFASISIDGRETAKVDQGYAEEANISSAVRLRVFVGDPGTEGRSAVTMFFLEKVKKALWIGVGKRKKSTHVILRFAGVEKRETKKDFIGCEEL